MTDAERQLLEKVGAALASAAINYLLKKGVINELQKAEADILIATEEFLGSIKTFREYPGDPQPQHSTSNIDR